MTKTKRKTKQRVPLSNEDEWGWEDNARKDLEMGSTNAKRTAESTLDLDDVLSSPVNNHSSSVSDSDLQRAGSQSGNSERTLPTSNLAGARGRSNNNASRMMTSVTKRTSGKHMLEPAINDYNDDNGGGESI